MRFPVLTCSSTFFVVERAVFVFLCSQTGFVSDVCGFRFLAFVMILYGFANLPLVRFPGGWASRKTRGLVVPSSARAGKLGSLARFLSVLVVLVRLCTKAFLGTLPRGGTVSSQEVCGGTTAVR